MRIRYYLGFLKRSIIYSIRNFYLRKNNKIGNKCRIHKSAILKGNVSLGNNVTIGRNAILGKNVKVGSNVVLRDILIGENSHIEGNVIVTGTEGGQITIGKECYIGFNIILDISSSIKIGDYVQIGSSLYTHSSAKQCMAGLPLKDKNSSFRPVASIVIENNVYIGVNCSIYPGVTIGHHVIVAPNSVVTKSIESNVLVGGVPAKIIKRMDNFLDA